MSAVPLERFHDLSDVPAAGYELDIAPGTEELRALAKWAGVEILEVSTDWQEDPDPGSAPSRA